jgi:hypothetical protein
LPPVTLISISAWSVTPRAFFCYVAFMDSLPINQIICGDNCEIAKTRLAQGVLDFAT